MDAKPLRPLFVTALVLALVIPILVAGGVGVRAYVRSSLHVAEEIRTARATASVLLRYQLDEETGVRGYAVTRERAFLQPYREARELLPREAAELGRALRELGLRDGVAALADASATNALWLRTVAAPIVARPNPRDGNALQRRGKALVDHVRADVARIQTAILTREAVIDGDTERAIDRINLVVLLAVVLVGGIGFFLASQQTRLTRTLAQHQREAAQLLSAYEAEKRVADTLKDAFVQKPLPVLDAVRFSATYTPAAEEAKVGGDWYDVVELDADRVLFVVGDVAGHGIEAAVAMVRARQELVSSAVADPDPASLLVRGNAQLLGQRARMVTAVCGIADARAFRFTYATAGHPPPVLVEPGREPRLLECGGMPLGLLPTVSYVEHTVQSLPGAMLVLYTDGALEHSHDVLAGERILLDAVAGVARSGVADAAGAIRDAIFSERTAGDDVAILTIAFAPAKRGRGVLAAGVARGGDAPGARRNTSR